MLKGLKEHNHDRRIAFFEPQLTNIACPICNKEVEFVWLGVIFNGLPAQRGIGCRYCGWIGSCVA